ncbi:MAG: transglycosylase SLT domain-containing protein, partial [Elusimicrobia bacterium]|nr:transglycosylase SLT domain-containing protein [Elusimicrobiota bacterium]MBD3412356.1 transglycosylase SLT domain-containing protein [Elusimicrobiota bacterium]
MRKKIIVIFFSFACIVISHASAEHASRTAATGDPSNPDQTRVLKLISEAEAEYAAGIDAYDLGNKKKAHKHFRRALKKLYSRHIDPGLLYGMSDYFEHIFTELNNRISLTETAAKRHAEMPPVPLEPDNPEVQKYIRIFSRNPTRRSIIRAFERKGRYHDMVLGVLREYGLPEELVYLPIIESRYSIGDVSWAGAVGLWQFMKHTARAYGLRVDFWIDERKDPEKSTRAAAQYLKELYFWFNDWHLALAAYNRGENGIGRDLKFSRTTNFNHLVERDAIPQETEKYVPQFMAITLIARDPLKYGIDFEYDDPAEYDTYTTDEMIDLEIAAQCAGTTTDTIRQLNPSLTAWCTPKNYPHFTLNIPAGSKKDFITALNDVDNLCPAREFVRYKVRKGDILGKISRKYHTSVRAIMRDN